MVAASLVASAGALFGAIGFAFVGATVILGFGFFIINGYAFTIAADLAACAF